MYFLLIMLIMINMLDLNGRKIIPEEVTEICLGHCPCSVVVNGREVLFVSKEKKDALRQFALDNGLKLSERLDVWGLLCEDCLDTETSEEARARVVEALVQSGVPLPEIFQIRAEVEDYLALYNLQHWDWVHLGHYDLLQAVGKGLTEEFYWWTMGVALRNLENVAS